MSLFVVYRYCANRPHPYTRTHSHETGTDQDSVVAALADVATSNDNFSLSVAVSNMESELEYTVREAIVKRLSDGCMYHGSGNVIALAPSGIPCYHCLLRANDEEVPVESGAMQTSAVAGGSTSVCSSDFVVCCVRVDTTVEELEQFRDELNECCCQLQSLPQAGFTRAAEVILSAWYDSSVGYLARCVQFFGQRLDVILQAGLVGSSIEVLGDNPGRQSDIDKFIRFLSLSSLHTKRKHVAPMFQCYLARLTKSFPMVTLTLSADGSSYSCSTTGTANTFCSNWASDMLAVKTEPVQLKKTIHNYELRILQDISSLQRILCRAVSHHYALYSAFRAIKSCQTMPSLVLSSLVDTVDESARPEGREVVYTLLKYVEDTNACSGPS